MKSIKSSILKILNIIYLFPDSILLKWLSRHAASKGKTRVILYLSIPLHLNFVRDLLQVLTNDPKFLVMVACNFPQKNITLPFGVHVLRNKKLIEMVPADFLLTSDAGKPVSRYPETLVVHIPHSLASMHVIYPEDAFDYFDIIFCSGPHHMSELSRILITRRITNCTLVPTGFEIIDRQRKIPRIITTPPTVVFAPSWGPDNALAHHGEEIINSLIDEYNVIIRPHVMSFTQDANILTRLNEKYGTNSHFSLDTTIDPQKTLAKADLVISDWSGIAFEYALAYHRPVIFIDGPMKVFNKKWSKYIPTPGIECTYRKEIGVVLQDLSDLKNTIQLLLAQSEEWDSHICKIEQKILYNRGACAKMSYIALLQLANGEINSKWVQI